MTGETTINELSRNGKLRSCEPCRRLKARCDHRIPVCGRCRSRCIAHKCSYRSTKPSITFPTVTPLMDMGNLSALPTPTLDDNIHQHYAFGSPTPPIDPIHQASASLPTPVPCSIDIRLRQVLAHLPHIKIISRLVRRWLQVCLSCPVPRPLLLDLLVAVESAAHRCNPGDGNTPVDDADLGQLAEDIHNASSQPLVVPRGLQPTEFFQVLTGRNLRAESIGLVLSVAGNAAFGLLESDVVFSSTGMY
ncbi:hypothetical protein EYZ11_000361 [Aspergillus tanneri]|uniref:Zn(2)-C6 fungal-type domain-containing protein n=1 Tax=Aspergillus tanneri TaxID=1220188 RepID=A0A4S3JXB3_9EURO|nr:hypothetical protein EYZ11_000361 [Aspergillus tanneri]